MSDLRERMKAAMENKRRELIAKPLAQVWGELTDTAIDVVAAHIETQRRDVPAHGWEFAAALRAEAQTEMGDE